MSREVGEDVDRRLILARSNLQIHAGEKVCSCYWPWWGRASLELCILLNAGDRPTLAGKGDCSGGGKLVQTETRITTAVLRCRQCKRVNRLRTLLVMLGITSRFTHFRKDELSVSKQS